MLAFNFVSYNGCKRYVFFLLLVLCVFGPCEVAYAEGEMFPQEVSVVKNESVMINRIIKGMRKHQSEFSFYYPGIYQDFKAYQRTSDYATFFEKLSKKDSYITGIVSGYCIIIRGEGKQYVTLQFCYLTTKKQEQKINKKVNQIVKRIGKGSTALKQRERMII